MMSREAWDALYGDVQRGLAIVDVWEVLDIQHEYRSMHDGKSMPEDYAVGVLGLLDERRERYSPHVRQVIRECIGNWTYSG